MPNPDKRADSTNDPAPRHVEQPSLRRDLDEAHHGEPVDFSPTSAVVRTINIEITEHADGLYSAFLYDPSDSINIGIGVSRVSLEGYLAFLGYRLRSVAQKTFYRNRKL